MCCALYASTFEVVVHVWRRGTGLAPPNVLLPSFVCQPQTSQHRWVTERGPALLPHAFRTKIELVEV